MARYAAFLRGINVGGNKIIKMADLREAFESLKLKNVKTILASGNVVFETELSSNVNLAGEIEKSLERKFTHQIGVLIRLIEELQQLADSDPFGKIKATSEITCYVTFLSKKSKGSLKLPFSSPDKSLNIIHSTGDEVLSFVDLSKGGHTVDLMKILDREYGKNITTRNWNTIAKILS